MADPMTQPVPAQAPPQAQQGAPQGGIEGGLANLQQMATDSDADASPQKNAKNINEIAEFLLILTPGILNTMQLMAEKIAASTTPTQPPQGGI